MLVVLFFDKSLGFGSRILVLLGYLQDGRNLSAVKEKL